MLLRDGRDFGKDLISLFAMTIVCNIGIARSKEKCMQNPKAADHRKGTGRQDSFQLEGKRKPTYTDWMKHRVDSEHKKRACSHRMSTVEPVFGNIVANKGLSRFSLHCRDKVQDQWSLYCMVHNIEKMNNYGDLMA